MNPVGDERPVRCEKGTIGVFFTMAATQPPNISHPENYLLPKQLCRLQQAHLPAFLARIDARHSIITVLFQPFGNLNDHAFRVNSGANSVLNQIQLAGRTLRAVGRFTSTPNAPREIPFGARLLFTDPYEAK